MDALRAMTPTPAPAIAWHSLAARAVLEKLESTREGLTAAVVAERQREYGPNTLPARQPPSLGTILLHQFASPLIYILLAAGTVAILMGDVTDAAFIFGVVLLNAALGTYQEHKAERGAASLQQLLRVTARVRRDGAMAEVDAETLVPGDLVALESGVKVPADLYLLETNNLGIDEAFLTGESVPASKRPDELPGDTPVSDRHNMAFAGAIVASGRGLGVVVATGLRTEVGRIAASTTAGETAKPPLVVRMERFSREISLVVVGACLILGTVAYLCGMPLVDVFFFSVALAVSAIPEGLPVAMTVALSIATSRMAKRHVIVRRLTAVEGLGSCTYIASDKTGTLTVNRQTVTRAWLPGVGDVPVEAAAPLDSVIRAGVMANEAAVRRDGGNWRVAGDAVDVALWDLARRHGVNPAAILALEKVGEIPFESERSFSAAFHRLPEDGGRIRVSVKGAPEGLADRCRAQAGPDGEIPLDRAAIDAQLAAWTEAGQRVIAFATGLVTEEEARDAVASASLPPLVLTGLAGLIDPPRPEVRDAVLKCRRAGIEVAMITGDHPRTALAIARAVGIDAGDDGVISGRELADIGSPDAPQFLDVVRRARVFARVSPLQKLQIVEALVALGHFVAVTGDGVNDAPALRRAHIGVAMGSGTDITKDTASIIVTDDNFASIEAGVEEGRFAYDNVRKVTYLLISAGFAEVLLFVMALLTNQPLPLLPVQLLWLNLVTNGIQDVALAFEGGEPGAIERPPRRPAEGIFNRLMIEQVMLSGAVTAVVAYANFWVLLNVMEFSEFDARDRLLLLMVLIENYHVFNCRSEYVSVFRVPMRRNPVLIWGVVAAQGLHILAMHVPVAQRVLQVAPITLAEWLVPFAMAATVLVAMEVFKVMRHGRRVAWPQGAAA